MKAAVYSQYGTPEVLQIRNVEKPLPKEHEILIRVKATAVNSGDWRLRKADPFAIRFIFGLLRPRITILGSVFSGVVESIGKEVKLFNVGDHVFGHSDMTFGTYAEYKCLPENASMTLLPKNISHNEAAVIPFGGVTALHFIRKAGIIPGQKVLVIGASGAVGSAVVQLAKYFGAVVTGVCSTANTALVKAIGADEVIDYKKEDFTANGESYDVIFDTVKAVSVLRSIRSINSKGRLILSGAGMSGILHGLWVSLTSNKRVWTGIISHKAADILFLKELIENGKLVPVIDRIYPLDRIAEAHAYVEKGHKKGNVGITIGQFLE